MLYHQVQNVTNLSEYSDVMK